MIPDIYLKILSSIDLRKQFYGSFHIIWMCVPAGMPWFKMVENTMKRLILLLSSADSSISLAIAPSSSNLSSIWLSKSFSVSNMSCKVNNTAFNFPLISRLSGSYPGINSSATFILSLAVVLCAFLTCFNSTNGSRQSWFPMFTN